MKAARMHGAGGPEVLAIDDVTMPEVAEGELLVRVLAASVNPVDYKIRAGLRGATSTTPVVLGRDVAGIVARGGVAAHRWKPGDAVFAMLERGHGGYAEYVTVREELCAPKPERLDFTQAAAVPLAGMTAWQGLFDHGGLEAGQRVLIHGGAGGVGHLAIQLAKARGAWVATTAARDDLPFVRDLGADLAIDYENERFEDVTQNLDLVFDLVAGEAQERSWAVLRRGGALVSTLGEPPPAEASRHGVRAVGYMAQPNGLELAEIGRLIDAGKVRPSILATYPLAQVRAAHERAERHHTRGKIVLAVAPA